MSVDSCFLATEDTLIVNENDPGSVIELYRNRNMETLL